MKISIITLFPEVFENVLNHSILKRAQEKGLVEFKIINHRDFGIGPHKIVDDKPYGGGTGMILKVDVLAKAIERARDHTKGELVILLCPQGEVYSQNKAENLSNVSHLILVCGHYEGFDERIRDCVDIELSIGDYVLTGGEIPALVIVDSITRLIPGVLKDAKATELESHSEIDGMRLLEGPQYTRPENYNNLIVPKIYLSGDPKKIADFKREKAIKKTQERRPDLMTKKVHLKP